MKIDSRRRVRSQSGSISHAERISGDFLNSTELSSEDGFDNFGPPDQWAVACASADTLLTENGR